MFIVLLTSIVNASNHAKCVSLNNKKCDNQPTFINLHPNRYCQELHYYPFLVKLDTCVRSCNILNDLSKNVCVPNKKKRRFKHVFNMITGKNASKILAKDISWEFICKYDEKKKCNSDQWWNNKKTSYRWKRLYLKS